MILVVSYEREFDVKIELVMTLKYILSGLNF